MPVEPDGGRGKNYFIWYNRYGCAFMQTRGLDFDRRESYHPIINLFYIHSTSEVEIHRRPIIDQLIISVGSLLLFLKTTEAVRKRMQT